MYCAGECVAENGNMLVEPLDHKEETFDSALQATSMMLAINKIIEMQGGLVVVGEKRVFEALPLPIAGLMTTEPAEKVCVFLRGLGSAIKKIGTTLENPFMLLSFLALPVIPELKITDKGLVDVLKFSSVPLQGDTAKNKK